MKGRASQPQLVWLEATARRENFSFDVFNDPGKFTKPFLAKYLVFIQLNYPPYRWSKAKAAIRITSSGARALGWGCITPRLGEFDGYPMWPWFSDFHRAHAVQGLHRPARVRHGCLQLRAPVFQGAAAAFCN